MLVQQPAAVLADEPVSALDVRLGREVLDLLTTLVKEQGATMVVSLHDLTLVDERFDRVIALREGRVLWERPPGELDVASLADLYGTEFAAFRGAFPENGR